MSRTTSKPPDWTEAVLKCDGNHGGPACGDPECWAIDWKIQCSSCLYKEVNRCNHWCYMFKDPPTDWCVPWRPVKTEGVPEDLSQVTSPDPRDAEIAALRRALGPLVLAYEQRNKTGATGFSYMNRDAWERAARAYRGEGSEDWKIEGRHANLEGER
jgi:hypothetical protein